VADVPRTVHDCSDHQDNLILDLAAEVGALLIVSSDTDLLSMSPWRGTPIIEPAAFAAKVDAMRRHARRRRSRLILDCRIPLISKSKRRLRRGRGTRQIGRTRSRRPDASSWPLAPPSLSSSLAVSRSLQPVAVRSAPPPRSGIADLGAAY